MKTILYITAALFLLTACSEEPVDTYYFDLDTRNGVFIACEGNFMYGNGSLSFYHKEDQKVSNQLFYARNNVPLGDVIQSLSREGDYLYIVVNNSGKIMVADAGTVEFKGSITGLVSPRHMHFISGQKAYVSDLYSHQITIVDPVSFKVTGHIPLNEMNSEQMVQIGKYVFASWWSYGDKVLVIDTETDQLVDSIVVPLQPKDLLADSNGRLWVLSDGGYEGSPAGNEVPAISRIDPETRTTEQVYRFREGDTPSNLALNSTGDTLYFLNKHLYKMHIGSRHLPDSAFIGNAENLFYNLAVDPENNDIYIADAIDYTQNAVIFRFNQSGTAVDTFRVGINPSDFIFR